MTDFGLFPNPHICLSTGLYEIIFLRITKLRIVVSLHCPLVQHSGFSQDGGLDVFQDPTKYMLHATSWFSMIATHIRPNI